MSIPTFTNDIRVTNDLESALTSIVSNYPTGKVYVVVDENTRAHCLPQLLSIQCLSNVPVLEIPSGEDHKSLDSVVNVWNFLEENGADRKSLLINLGGGMLSDLCGFAASCFKRGLHFVNIPTTLLSQVDASVGGKTGINFNGLKNEIGAFHKPTAVLFYTDFFESLDEKNRLSSYAEMLKHGLLSDEAYWNALLRLSLDKPKSDEFLQAVKRSVEIKDEITTTDPTEKGLRKALNLGHTVGHAFESLSHARKQPVLHGYAIAWVLLCELYLSTVLLNFPQKRVSEFAAFVKANYGVFNISCTDYDFLYETMTHDKKNQDANINFTLLSDIGAIHLDQTANRELLDEMFDFYCDALGI